MTVAASAVIRPGALRHNLAEVRRRSPGCRVLAVIKANAYGHGLLQAAGILDDADAFAVARVEEAVQLRQAGISKRLVVLGGFADAEDLATAVQMGVDLVVHTENQVALLEAHPPVSPLSVWVKIDTGMGRLGLAPDALPAVRERLARLPGLRPPLVAMSHLASADNPDDPATGEQLACFERLLGSWVGDISIANSAGILGWPETVRTDWPGGGCNWVRPGLMLYGVSPLAGGTGADLGLRAALSFETRLLAVRSVARGARIGYGGHWTAPRDSLIGIAAAGYADGYPWQLPSGTPVLVGGHLAQLVGRVSMDMVTLDLTGLPPQQPGAPVVLWGPEPAPPVEQIAQAAGTIPYTLLAGLNRRVALRLDDELARKPAAGRQPQAALRSG
ncbi:MAG: alanine racemase [Chromatiales bacterium]|nr:alanine racemase [Chromatiales bacterium]